MAEFVNRSPLERRRYVERRPTYWIARILRRRDRRKPFDRRARVAPIPDPIDPPVVWS